MGESKHRVAIIGCGQMGEILALVAAGQSPQPPRLTRGGRGALEGTADPVNQISLPAFERVVMQGDRAEGARQLLRARQLTGL